MINEKDLENFKNEILLGVQRSINIAILHHKNFSEFKNKFLGQTVVLVGAGPTLKFFEPIENAIYIGVNRTFLFEQIKFDYLFAIDKNGLETKENSYTSNFLNYLGNNCVKFVGDQNCGINLQIPEGKLNNSIRRYKTTSNLVPSKFTVDIESEPIGNFYSVSFQAMQFILYTNPAKIYLIGMDSNVATEGHFTDTEEKKKHESLIGNTIKCVKSWQELKVFKEIYYPDTQIISVNPVGLKGIFEDEYTEKYRNSKEKERYDKDFKEFWECPSKNYLQQIKFSEQYNVLVERVKKKKVIIYGTGLLFQSIARMVDLSKIKIIGISDKKYSTYGEKFLGYDVIPKNDIFKTDADCILVAVQEYEAILKELKQRIPKNKNIQILPLAKKFEVI